MLTINRKFLLKIKCVLTAIINLRLKIITIFVLNIPKNHKY